MASDIKGLPVGGKNGGGVGQDILETSGVHSLVDFGEDQIGVFGRPDFGTKPCDPFTGGIDSGEMPARESCCDFLGVGTKEKEFIAQWVCKNQQSIRPGLQLVQNGAGHGSDWFWLPSGGEF